MKRLWKILFIIFCVLLVGAAIAQAIPGLSDLIGADWAEVGVKTGAFAVVINAVVLLASNVIPALKGAGKYVAAILVGVGGGVIMDLTHFLQSPDYSMLPTPLEGIVFGLMAALIAVGFHQGAKQGAELRKQNTASLQ